MAEYEVRVMDSLGMADGSEQPSRPVPSLSALLAGLQLEVGAQRESVEQAFARLMAEDDDDA